MSCEVAGRDLGVVAMQRVAAPDRGGISGAGWRLTLNAGWEVVPADRAGDYTIRKR